MPLVIEERERERRKSACRQDAKKSKKDAKIGMGNGSSVHTYLFASTSKPRDDWPRQLDWEGRLRT
jgi:hypothetical protein